MNLITMETHSRDIVISMIEDQFDTKDCFKWVGQLKTRFETRGDAKEDDIWADICDASFQYSFEYLGNPGRLVITPLTDRIYITATQSSHLNLGCAPAAAGTGKTGTGLSAALGKAVYVFNCGPEMDYRTMEISSRASARLAPGGASTSSTGCLRCSRCARCSTGGARRPAPSRQVRPRGYRVRMHPLGCMSFITMNGYLGRAELPESLRCSSVRYAAAS